MLIFVIFYLILGFYILVNIGVLSSCLDLRIVIFEIFVFSIVFSV